MIEEPSSYKLFNNSTPHLYQWKFCKERPFYRYYTHPGVQHICLGVKLGWQIYCLCTFLQGYIFLVRRNAFSTNNIVSKSAPYPLYNSAVKKIQPRSIDCVCRA
jgi:hypothetical protein